MSRPVFPEVSRFPCPCIADLFDAHLSMDDPDARPELPDFPDFETPEFDDPDPAPATRSTRTLRRPRRSEALALLMLAGLGRALPDDAALARMFEPGAITPVRPPAPGFEEAIEKALSGQVLRALRTRAAVDDEDAADPKIRIFAVREGQAPRDQSSELRRERAMICEEVRRGLPVLLVTGERDLLRGDLAALEQPELRLPRVSADLLLEVLARTHPDDFDAAAVRPLLPAPGALARLAPLAIGAAFLLPTAEAVAERLARMVRPADAPALTLADVRGQREAVRILRRMVDDLARWREGALAWSQVTASAVFIGPPGTGKTMAAEATAGSAGVPFIGTSYSACQKMGHQGDMLAELHARVTEAITRAPSVFFLDELDSFLTRSDDGNSARYQRGVVNGLLEQLTRLASAEGVLVLGATNHLGDVDPAVVRSGRFDLKIAMGLPDAAGLEDLLTTGLARLDPKPKITTRTIAALARRLLGCTGADVAALVRDAASRARSAGRAVSGADLAAAADRLAPPLDAELDRRITLHEVGHLLVGHLCGRPAPRLVRLTAQGGFVAGAASPLHTLDTAEAELAALMGGRAAEIVVFGAPSSGAGEGPDSDLARATRLALQVDVQWRLSDGGLCWTDATREGVMDHDPALRARVEARLRAAESTALALLDRHTPALHRIARTLQREREFDAERIAALLADVDRDGAEPDEAPQVIPFPLVSKDPDPHGAA